MFHRTQFLERITKRLKRKPASGTHCLVYIRPDKFGEVRDKVGIIQSEEILAQFAEFIRKRMHPRDVAGRFEGTSFMVLLERGSARDAQVWGQQLIDQLQKTTFEVGETSTHMTCTVGACGVSEVFATLEEFVAATIRAHEQGKAEGGSQSMLEGAKRRRHEAKGIRRYLGEAPARRRSWTIASGWRSCRSRACAAIRSRCTTCSCA